MITTLTISTLVRSFASMVMNDDMTPRDKRIAVILFSVIISVCYGITQGQSTFALIFTNVVGGIVAGLTAMGIYHATDVSSQNSQTTVEEG